MRARSNKGLSLIETLVSTVVLLVVSGAAFNALDYYIRTYSSNQLRAGVQMGAGGALELMAQEIGQAGLLNFTGVLSEPVTASPTVTTVSLSSVESIFVGETLTIDNGDNQETVAVTALNASQITAIFKKTHAKDAPVNAMGVFPEGILGSSTGTELRLFGDINADGSLVYVKYTCDMTKGQLLRSVTTITPSTATATAAVPLVSNLVANPGGTPCFQYAPQITVKGFTFITYVAVTITVKTATRDLQTNKFVTMTRPVLNVSPRNIISGLNLALAGYTSRLQAKPPNIPMT